MSDPIPFPSAQRSLVGGIVKVCRHGECLWLRVKHVRPSGMMVAIVDNHPREWPEKYGDPVEIKPEEIIMTWDAKTKRLPHEGKCNEQDVKA